MSKVSELVEYHLKTEPIVYKYVEGPNVIYMIKSISGPNKSYNVVFENNQWSCDCQSFKFKCGVTKEGHCKHISLVTFLIQEKIKIKEI
jgi:hypothetical protein